MSLVVARNIARGLAVRRAPVFAARRSVQTVPKLGTEAEMEAQAVEQIRARIAYQKELMAAKPHKSFDEEWEELWTWIKISIYVCGPVVIFGIFKDLVIEEHHHRPDGPLPEYMKIRSKEFPWECGDCDLMDLSCWKKCRAEKK
mmetsp:Transcript_18976/g.30606  ORF Transcript_18976/g.30606 Transcript_18976/m.30606 type:complete len:144 (-) Transcript_18976:205-636(-)